MRETRSPRDPLTRGELARRSGIGAETVRYYEQRGLLPKPPRSPSNYRLYPPDTLRRVRFIKGAQELGFTLREIKDLLGMCWCLNNMAFFSREAGDKPDAARAAIDAYSLMIANGSK